MPCLSEQETTGPAALPGSALFTRRVSTFISMMHSTTSATKTSTTACYTLHFALGKHFSGIRAASGPLYPTVSATAEFERSIATWCGSIHSVRIGLCRICQFHSLKDSRLHVEISPHVEAWSRLQLSLIAVTRSAAALQDAAPPFARLRESCSAIVRPFQAKPEDQAESVKVKGKYRKVEDHTVLRGDLGACRCSAGHRRNTLRMLWSPYKRNAHMFDIV